ncbi:MAG: hypothetical protein HeimC2_17500, partial [Candidatus Heimdallarchaeota archaeon LC_2]
ESGLLPEIPYRPSKPKTITNPLIKISNSTKSLHTEPKNQMNQKEGVT